MLRTWLILPLLSSAVLMTGCSGGGGSGGGDGSVTPVTGPGRFQTREYRAMGGHDIIKAAEGYDVRATGGEGGQGTLISIVDSGVEEHFDLDIASSFALVGTPFDDPAPHGTHVAGVAAARKNGRGVHGVAFNARIVSHKIAPPDFSNANQLEEEGVIAVAIGSSAGIERSYRLEDGSLLDTNPDGEADIINMSFTTTDASGQVLDAMRRAASRGKIMTIALGNEALVRPVAPPAIYVTDPQMSGHAIAVGALDVTGTTDADFSNLCGNVRQFCLFAPGEQITSTVPGDRFAALSGTSFAAPHVAGAAAVLRSAFPNRSPRQIVNRILTTADDLGEPGIDDRFGHGRLNLERALNPVGFASVPMSAEVDGAGIGLAGTSIALPGWARAGELSAALAEVLVHDSQQFPFTADLGSVVRRKASETRLDSFIGKTDREAGEIRAGEVLSLALAHSSSFEEIAGTRHLDRLQENGTIDAYELGWRLSDGVGLNIGRGWGLLSGHRREALALAGSDLSILGEALSPFGRLAGVDDVLKLDAELGAATRLEVAIGQGDMRDGDMQGGGQSRIGSMTLTRRLGDRLALSTTLGMLEEDETALGGRALGSAGGLGAETRFVDVTATAGLSEDLAVFGSYTSGWTERADADPGLIRGMALGRSDAYAIGISLSDLLGQDRLALSLAQPLRPTSASMSLMVPTGEDGRGGVVRERREVDLSPDGRERMLQLVYQRQLEEVDMTLSVGAFARMEPDHDADARTEAGAGMRVGYRF